MVLVFTFDRITELLILSQYSTPRVPESNAPVRGQKLDIHNIA